MKKVFITVFL